MSQGSRASWTWDRLVLDIDYLNVISLGDHPYPMKGSRASNQDRHSMEIAGRVVFARRLLRRR